MTAIISIFIIGLFVILCIHIVNKTNDDSYSFKKQQEATSNLIELQFEINDSSNCSDSEYEIFEISFNIFDKNNDGYLDLIEFTSYFEMELLSYFCFYVFN